MDSTYEQLVNDYNSLIDELAQRRKDAEDAAGELLIAIPRPGTDAAKLLIANRVMANQIDHLRHELNAIRDSVLNDMEIADLRDLLSSVNPYFRHRVMIAVMAPRWTGTPEGLVDYTKD